MKRYAVILLSDEQDSGTADILRNVDPSVFDYYSSRGLYFVRFAGTAQQLAERIGFASQHGARLGLVTSLGQYDGFANRDLWNWLSIS